jgi:hypothetical protein
MSMARVIPTGIVALCRITGIITIRNLGITIITI